MKEVLYRFTMVFLSVILLIAMMCFTSGCPKRVDAAVGKTAQEVPQEKDVTEILRRETPEFGDLDALNHLDPELRIALMLIEAGDYQRAKEIIQPMKYHNPMDPKLHFAVGIASLYSSHEAFAAGEYATFVQDIKDAYEAFGSLTLINMTRAFTGEPPLDLSMFEGIEGLYRNVVEGKPLPPAATLDNKQSSITKHKKRHRRSKLA